MFRADLHCHTTCSDGSLTPEEIISLAVEQGLSALSITDHDSIAAYPDAITLAKQKGLLMGTGVEFSCMHQGTSVHVLGYRFAPDAQGILDLCEKHQKRRKDRNLAILESLRKRGIDIKDTELPKIGTVGRPHIAQLLIDRGRVANFKDAFTHYLGEGKCCYVQGAPISVEETINILHEAKAKAFIAHPHLFPKASFVKNLLALPFDGLECYYAKCPPQQEGRWVRMAQEKGLLISGGSDFHGPIKPHIPLGASWVSEEAFYKIFGHA